MPELPDVEGFRRSLARRLPGRRVERVRVLDAGVLHGVTPNVLGRRLHGRRFAEPQRHGKWLVLPTEDAGSLVLHSGMTGHPYYADDPAAGERFDRVVVDLDRGALRYSDLRKLRGIWFLPDGAALETVSGRLGPDALGLTRPQFRDVLAGRRGRLKSTLMDQTVLAGLGNLLTDEICWHARTNPAVRVPELDDAGLARLHAELRRVLDVSVRHGCVPSLPRWLTRVRDDDGGHCPRCGTRLRRGRIDQRATVWCPNCQPYE